MTDARCCDKDGHCSNDALGCKVARVCVRSDVSFHSQNV